LLVTEKPALVVPPVKTPRDLIAYRDASWLIKNHAVTVKVAMKCALNTLRMRPWCKSFEAPPGARLMFAYLTIDLSKSISGW
jgi:hypothetical protein